LFSISEEVGVGLVLWHPKGTLIRNLIRDYWEKEHLKNGYQLVCTPHIAREMLWQTSGHLEYYRDNMYLFEKDGENYVVKPMNCPFHIEIYKTRPRSYRELPIRYAEWGTVYRYERSGTLHGLMRVRGFTQDDAHIFCTSEQVKQEILSLLDFTRQMLR
jgi:threonyl-tRNA synthetase